MTTTYHDNMPSPSQQLGFEAERVVLRALKQRGYQLWFQNLHCPFGELDLVMYRNHTLHIIEVKYRTGGFHTIGDFLTPTKQKRLLRSTSWFLSEFDAMGNFSPQIDIALLSKEPYTGRKHLRLYHNALNIS